MTFNTLHQQVDALIEEIIIEGFIGENFIKTLPFLEKLNKSSFFITIHDVETYRPVVLNNAMRDFYGFESNQLKGINYVYYLNTIHVSTYSSLIKSVSFFRKNNNGYLDLSYKLLYKRKEWKSMQGTSKTFVWSKKNKPKYAISILKEVQEELKTKDDFIECFQHSLTKKEKQIATLLKNNTSKVQIQEILNISASTLHSHQKKIFKKLNISKVHELIVLDEDYMRPESLQKELFGNCTKREKQVLGLLGIGLSKKEIAMCLNTAESTINTHTKNIFKKLKVGSVSEIIQMNKNIVHN